MKNKLFFIAVFLPFCLSSQWDKISVTTSQTLNAIANPSASSIIIVGDSGTILKSSNNGSSFNKILAPNVQHLKAVAFSSNNIGFAVGSAGTIIKSSNGGSVWSSVSSPSNVQLNAITFYDSSNGLIAGNNGCILKTVDAGAHWTNITPVTVYLLNKIYYLSGSSVIICGANGVVLHSSNGGSNWTNYNSGTTRYLSDLLRYQDSLLVLGDKGIALRANEDFSVTTKDSLCLEQLISISCSNERCLSVGKSGRILASLDTRTWMPVALPYQQDYNDVHYLNDTIAIIVGTEGLVLKTTKGGFSNAVEEMQNIPITVYPNPSQGTFNIEWPSTFGEEAPIISLSDNYGNALPFSLSEISKQHLCIYVNFEPGMYLLHFSSRSKVHTTKIIVY